jgi:hypothetical protein
MTDHLTGWQRVVGSADQRAAVRDHLAFLARTDADRRLLDLLMARLVGATADADALRLRFRDPAAEGEIDVECGPPGSVAGADEHPPSAVEVYRVHRALSWGGDAPEAIGYPAGNWAADYVEDLGDGQVLARLAAAGLGAEAVRAAFDIEQDCVVWDPTRLNALGEPALCFVSHEGGGLEPDEELRDLSFGQAVLRLMALSILGDAHLDG